MTKAISALQVLAAVVATCGLCWLIANVNQHADEVQRGWVGLWLVAAFISSLPTAVPVHAPVRATRRY